MTRFSIIAFAAAALAVASITGASAQQTSDSGGDRIRFRCEAEGQADFSMSAKYEERAGGRRKFSTEFEAAPNVGFKVGDRIVTEVKGVKAGVVRLERVVGGDLVGDLNLDTNPNEDAEPFPGNFPKNVGRGAKVAVLKGGEQILSCSLR